MRAEVTIATAIHSNAGSVSDVAQNSSTFTSLQQMTHWKLSNMLMPIIRLFLHLQFSLFYFSLTTKQQPTGFAFPLTFIILQCNAHAHKGSVFYWHFSEIIRNYFWKYFLFTLHIIQKTNVSWVKVKNKRKKIVRWFKWRSKRDNGYSDLHRDAGARYIQRDNSPIFKHSLMAGIMWLFDIYSEMHKKHLSAG